MFTNRKDTAIEESKTRKVELNLFEKLEYYWIKRQIHKKMLNEKCCYRYSWLASQMVMIQLRIDGFKCYYCRYPSGTIIFWDMK